MFPEYTPPPVIDKVTQVEMKLHGCMEYNGQIYNGLQRCAAFANDVGKQLEDCRYQVQLLLQKPADEKKDNPNGSN